MADAPKDMPQEGRTLIRNIGLLLTGDLEAPIADRDCILVENGVIVGFETGDADREIDAAGGCVAPGGGVAPWARPVLGAAGAACGGGGVPVVGGGTAAHAGSGGAGAGHAPEPWCAGGAPVRGACGGRAFW